MKKVLVITIDGPAGTGKSTVARLLANRLGFRYLDTGALYRMITYQALKKKISPTGQQSLAKLLKSIRIKFKGSKKVFLNGKDVTAIIRKPYITDNVFRYAKLPFVRRTMLKIQRALGEKGNIVAEGRDLGSVVFPDAPLKFYLDASISERAKRRWKELKQSNYSVRYANILREIRIRDQHDKTRPIAPLKKAKDAVRIDTTRLSVKQVIQKLLAIIKRKCLRF